MFQVSEQYLRPEMSWMIEYAYASTVFYSIRPEIQPLEIFTFPHNTLSLMRIKNTFWNNVAVI